MPRPRQLERALLHNSRVPQWLYSRLVHCAWCVAYVQYRHIYILYYIPLSHIMQTIIDNLTCSHSFDPISTSWLMRQAPVCAKPGTLGAFATRRCAAWAATQGRGRVCPPASASASLAGLGPRVPQLSAWYVAVDLGHR